MLKTSHFDKHQTIFPFVLKRKKEKMQITQLSIYIFSSNLNFGNEYYENN